MASTRWWALRRRGINEDMTRPRNQLGLVGHLIGAFSCASLLWWWWLNRARDGHFLPPWIPVAEYVALLPAAVCFLVGMFVTGLAAVRWRGWTFLQGLFSVFVGLYGVLAAFMFVFESSP